MNIIYSTNKIFKKMSNIGKLLIIVVIFLLIIVLFRTNGNNIENFESENVFNFINETSIYDGFYSDIYDTLVYNQLKDNYEIGEIINSTQPNNESIILDIGSGTGHHVDLMNKRGFKTIGLDSSINMIHKSTELYPNYKFIQGDAMDTSNFNPTSFTHIMCLYFTIYYINNKSVFFNNCYYWLKPGGHLIVHIVNRELFDPIIPPANPLVMISPQRYAKKRITTSKVAFDKFNYFANFILNPNNNEASFVEKFKNKTNDKTFRMQEHKMYMESEEDILTIARNCGFIIIGKIDLIKVAYEYQFLYIFQKPE
jgi:SAM-dependent methyltransferase